MALIMRRIASWIRRVWPMPGYFCSTMHEHLADQRQVAQVGDLEQAGAQAVVDVVVVVGDVVAQRRDLRLGPGMAVELEIVVAAIFDDRRRQVGQRAAALSSGPLCLTAPSSVSQVRLRPLNSA